MDAGRARDAKQKQKQNKTGKSAAARSTRLARSLALSNIFAIENTALCVTVCVSVSVQVCFLSRSLHRVYFDRAQQQNSTRITSPI